jgi:hypothetical protein
MISISDAFLKFKSRLEITEREQADASRRQKRIRELLHQEFDIERDVLTGSYARHTKTKPLKDVDIFCILGEKEQKYRKEHPSKLLKDFQKVLSEEYGSNGVTQQRRCVQVDFGLKAIDDDSGEQVMSFDVVPAFAVNNHHEIPDITLSSWVKTDPEVHKELATKLNESFSGQWKPIVKMIKKWNETHNKPVKPSFLLEVMALQVFVPPFSGGYPYEVKSFFATAVERIGDTWEDPAQLGPPVSDQMDSSKVAKAREVFRRAEETVSRALRLAREDRNGDALQEWRKLFGPLFPLS